mgnify:CR=1 FL=1
MVAPARILALDTETTGTDPRHDRIVELYIAELDDRLSIEGELLQRFNPGVPIPFQASLVHGIRDIDVANEPSFADRAGRIQRLLEGALVIAYNGARFDMPLLHRELVRAGLPGLDPRMPIVDPLALFRKDYPHTLTRAVDQYLARPHVGAHGARADTLATIDVLVKQWAKRKPLQPKLTDLAGEGEKAWLDWSRCFYEDPLGVVRFGFGKHRDQPAASQPGYLAWMRTADFDDGVKAVAARLQSGATVSPQEAISVA